MHDAILFGALYNQRALDKLGSKFDRLGSKMDSRFDAIDARLDRMQSDLLQFRRNHAPRK